MKIRGLAVGTAVALPPNMPGMFFESLSSWRGIRCFGAGTLWSSPWINDGGVRRKFMIARIDR